MAPFYRVTCEQLGWELDAALLEQMEAANSAELAQASSIASVTAPDPALTR